MLNVTNLYKYYPSTSAAEQLPVLADVSLSVDDGEVLGIIGPSGCGKTTLLKIMAGLEPWDEGTVTIDGVPLTGPGPDRRMVFQDFALLPWRTVIANVEFGLEVKGIPREVRSQQAAAILLRTGLRGFENYLPHQLSGGMQQRVGLARALAVDPTLLLLDEPLSALDAQTRRFLMGDLVRLIEESGKSAVLVTHDMEEAVTLCDRVIVLCTGPAKIVRVLEVSRDLPRPRAGTLESIRTSLPFANLVEEIWLELVKATHDRDEVGRAGVAG